jgi:multimeric flavodoxin WrbA
MKCFLDRAFFVASANGGWFRHKVGASVAAVRRSGGIAAFDGLNHYLAISDMIMPGSSYWNVIHGQTEGQAANDAEGIQIMRILGKNIAWLLKMKERSEYTMSDAEIKVYTNFIR